MRFWRGCKRYAWTLGALIGVLLLGLGASQGQLDVIWKKAVMICLECIGIG
ncbi:CD1871A family CXXC motif-containing protein [Colidextribacter sp. OB.20]|uniref:CD1871A family CXXC motif-containing protein n=1 Tax=Colidextribacter sp. OB.20 TaxID=2304568 RepID=UPI00191C6768|nr:CD1871A family CXXC motif-containing protein [Colidextribacter sp. OB.20]